MKKYLALPLIFALLISTSALSTAEVKSEPRTIVVPVDYFTIQDAVNHANPGDRILVRSGTYIESQLNL